MDNTYSTFGSLNWFDLVKGAITAVLAAALPAILAITDSGVLPTNAQWKVVGITGVSAFIGYILKNLSTNSKGKLGTETKTDGKSN